MSAIMHVDPSALTLTAPAASTKTLWSFVFEIVHAKAMIWIDALQDGHRCHASQRIFGPQKSNCTAMHVSASERSCEVQNDSAANVGNATPQRNKAEMVHLLPRVPSFLLKHCLRPRRRRGPVLLLRVLRCFIIYQTYPAEVN